MTIYQMKYFITIAECLSISKAADKLYVSQPALSRHIQNLEREYNIQLFVRTNEGIRLTPAGSVLYLGFSEIYENYVNLIDKAEKVQRGMTGSLKIGVLDETNIADFMPQVYQYFKDNHPDVDLIFQASSFEKLLTGLYNGNLDLAFTVKFNIEKKERILYQYVSHSKDHIVMTKFHPLASKEHVTLEDVKNETFVMISREDNPESSPLIFEICKKHGFVPQTYYAKTLAELILWVEAGVGITILDSRTSLKLNPDIKFYEIESHWEPSLVVAWNQYDYNPLIPAFLKKLNEVMGLGGEDIHGFSLEQQ